MESVALFVFVFYALNGPMVESKLLAPSHNRVGSLCWTPKPHTTLISRFTWQAKTLNLFVQRHSQEDDLPRLVSEPRQPYFRHLDGDHMQAGSARGTRPRYQAWQEATQPGLEVAGFSHQTWQRPNFWRLSPVNL